MIVSSPNFVNDLNSSKHDLRDSSVKPSRNLAKKEAIHRQGGPRLQFAIGLAEERLYWSTIKREKQRTSCTYMTVVNRSLRKLPWPNIWHRVCLSVGSHSTAVKDRGTGRRSEFDKTAPDPGVKCFTALRGRRGGGRGGGGGGKSRVALLRIS